MNEVKKYIVELFAGVSGMATGVSCLSSLSFGRIEGSDYALCTR